MTIKTILRPTLIALLSSTVLGAYASGSSSENFAIDWDVADGGGDMATSATFVLQDTAAQPTATGFSSSASFALQAGFLTPPDSDADGVRNFLDNCTQDANADQRDSNGDGFGNVCDADFNNDGVTNVIDLGILRLRFFTGDADADLNGDGVVNVVDLGLLRLRFFTAPGPSGIAP